MTRHFDIVVWGATGFTGRLITEYLAAHAPDHVKLAVAGRNKQKLEQILASANPHNRVISILIGEADDLASLDAIAIQTKVVISSAGPYLKYGFGLVDACVRSKTDYVDLTGEPEFIRAIIEKHHEQAQRDGTLIVPSCGFDSVPSDLGTLMIADEFKTRKLKTHSVKLCVVKASGGVSGGTIASLSNMLSSSSIRALISFAGNPDYLSPVVQKNAKNGTLLYHEPAIGKWVGPFFMEATNMRYVRRTNHLLKYGDQFQYGEGVVHKSFFLAAIAAVVQYLAIFLILFPPIRWVIARIIPPGTGPSEKQRKEGYFNLKLVGESEPDASGNREKLTAIVKGIQDPGYAETAKMISESALCLALQREKLNKAHHFTPVKGGVVTAASCMGLVLAKRLQKAGMTFELEK